MFERIRKILGRLEEPKVYTEQVNDILRRQREAREAIRPVQTIETMTQRKRTLGLAFDDLGDLLKVGDDLGILVGLGEGDADEGADVQSDGLGFDQQAGAGDDTVGFQALDTLVDGRAGDTALAGNLQVSSSLSFSGFLPCSALSSFISFRSISS